MYMFRNWRENSKIWCHTIFNFRSPTKIRPRKLPKEKVFTKYQ